MAVQTRIFTNHQVSQPGSPFVAGMMLDDQGLGNLTLNTTDGRPALSMDAAHLEVTIAILQESLEIRRLMAQTGTDLLTGEADQHSDAH